MLGWRFQDDTDIGTFVRLLSIFCLIGIVGFMIFGPAPKRPPSAMTLTGCFVTAGAAVRFDGTRITFPNDGIGPLDYHIAFEKYGTLAVEVGAPVRLAHDADGSFHFREGDSGWNDRMRLTHVVNGKSYGVTEASNADYLEMLDQNGERVSLSRASSERCGIDPT